MKWRYTIIGFTAGIVVSAVIVATFFSFKATRNLHFGSYTFKWDRKDNVFVENSDESLWVHVNAWGDELECDGISAYRIAPSGDSAYTGIKLFPDGFKLSVSIKKNGDEYFLFDNDGDGFFERLVKDYPARIYDVTYEIKENKKYSNQAESASP